MDKIVIFGTGGFAREVHEILKENIDLYKFADKHINFLGFIDDEESKHGEEIHGSQVLGGLDWLKENKDVSVVMGIGNPETKKKLINRIKAIHSFDFPKIVHPKAIVGSNVEIGEGSIICAYNILTTDIQIGDFVTINLSCTIGHDSVIGDYVNIAPGSNISGNVNICEGTDVGTGSVVIQGKNIGEWSIIGAGAVVVKDISSHTTSVGNPAKVIKERNPIHS